MCREFTKIIGEVLEEFFLEQAKQSPYIYILCDGSTDVSNIEKELVYVTFLDTSSHVKTQLFFIKDDEFVHAKGLTKQLITSFSDVGVDLKTRLVGFCADGASVNMGTVGGVAALLSKDIPAPCLVVIHCVSHYLELGIKDAFKGSEAESVTNMFLNMYLLYEKSAKRLRELNSITILTEEQAAKPGKSSGTRWIQHKYKACNVLILDYPVIVTHFEAQAADGSDVSPADRARMKGYLKTLKSVKFVLNMLYMKVILGPLGEISEHLQKDSIELHYVGSC